MLRRYEFHIFTLVRILGVGIRPLVLYLCVALPRPELGLDYALLVSAVASSMLLLSNQNFRQIYDYFTLENDRRRGLGGRELFIAYLESTIIHIFIFIPIAALVCWIWTRSLDLTLLCMVFTILEKYFDDDQRIAIYQRRYLDWSINFSFRVIGPSLILLAFAIFWVEYALYSYASAALVFAGLYVIFFRSKFAKLLWHWLVEFTNHPALWWSRVKYYGTYYRKELFFAQIWVFISGNFNLLDRLIISNFNPEILAEYLFFSNIANLIPFFHTIFYFTKVRPQLVDRGSAMSPPILSFHNWSLPFVSAILFSIAFLLGSDLGYFSKEIGFITVIGLGSLYSFTAVTLVVLELAFWRIKRGWMIATELIGISIVVAIVFACYKLEVLTFSLVPFILLFGFLCKLSFLVFLLRSAHSNPKFRVTDLDYRGL